MTHRLIHSLLCGIFLLGVSITDLPAQFGLPAAWGFQAGQTKIFGGGKYYLVLAGVGDSKRNYQLIGISDTTNSSGTWGYFAGHYTSPDYGPWTSELEVGNQLFFFAGGDVLGGQFSTTGPDAEGNLGGPYGNMWIAFGHAPASPTNQTFYLTITDGNIPFASKGTVIFTPTSDGNYTATPASPGIAASQGTYSYSVTNSVAGCFSLNDDASGVSTEYFCYSSSTNGFFMVTQPSGGYEVGTFVVSSSPAVPALFFTGQSNVTSNIAYLYFSNGTAFGYYNMVDFKFPLFYHYDLGFEWFFDANNSSHGAYLYDFSSGSFFYTAPNLFPFLYDFTLKTWLYYYPDPNQPGHYASSPRYFYSFTAKKIITK